MPIKPSFQVNRRERHFVASKQFTDREFPRDVFHRKLNELLNVKPSNEPTHHVVTYYGVGGIGKTSLQKQLKVELLQQVPQAMYTSLDFSDQAVHAPARALLELARATQFKQKVKFPHFEVAYSIYFYKRNPDVVYNKKQLPFLEQMNVVGTVLSALDGMGLIGSVTGIISLLYESSRKWGLNKAIKRDLTELETCSAQQIEERLPAFFAYDIQQAIDKFRVPVTVLFLDTYEAIWSSSTSDATKHTRDAWVRELIALLPDVLFVICGREYIDWATVDSDWRDVLDQHLLDSLDEKNASRFLEVCGVNELDVRERIISASGGHPYHLDLSVDTYFEMKNRGVPIKAEAFGSNKREILDRFLKYLSEEEVQALKIISVPRFYDYDLFRHLLFKYPTGYPLTKFDDFNKFSFIHQEGAKYFIHTLMRDGMRELVDDSLLVDIHQSIGEYYENILGEAVSNARSLQTTEYSALLEAFYHKKNCDTVQGLIDWLDARLPILKGLQLSGDVFTLRSLLEELYTFNSAYLSIELFGILVDMVHLNGHYEQAVEMIDKRIGSLSEESWGPLELNLSIRKVHHQMFNVPVQGLLEVLIRYEPIARENNWAQEYNELLFMIGGNLGVLSGDLRLARKWLVCSIRSARSSNRPDHLCRALRKYSDVLRLYGHTEWAKAACSLGLEIAREEGYDRYESYLLVTLADIHRMHRNYDMAYELLKQADAIIQTHGIVAWGGHLQLTHAEILFEQGDCSGAAKHFEIGRKVYINVNQTWGRIQAELGLERCRLNGVATDISRSIHEIREEALRMGYLIQVALADQITNRGNGLVNLPYL